MGRLGDFFPKHKKQEYIDRQLKPGQVLYLQCEFINPQKDKYLVLACPGTRPLLFIINSKIPPFIEKHPDLHKCQVKLCASDYSFLDHDSFVDCAKVIDYFDESEIRQQVLDDVGRIKGELNTATRKAIIKAVHNAKSITPRHKRLIVDSLK
jgi:hypothetical protein